MKSMMEEGKNSKPGGLPGLNPGRGLQGDSRRGLPSMMLRALVLALAVAATVYGAFRGEAQAVLRKAAKICLECIGIG